MTITKDKRITLILILIVAFLIRLIALNQSLWLDEATTAQVVKQYNLVEIVAKFSPKDFHPPFYYLFMKLWTNVFGYSEIALRMPSIIFSLATGWIIYLLGGVWASALFLFNPLIVYYSQEARMYLMAAFFLTAALYFFLVIASKAKQYRQNEIATAGFAGLAMTAAFFTFYGSAFFIAAFFVYLIYKKQNKVFFLTAALLLLAGVIISPLLFKQLSNSKIALATVANWSIVLGKANLKNLLLIPIKFSIGRIDFYPKWIYYSVAGIWTGLTWFFIAKEGMKNKLLLFFLAGPLAFGLLFSFFTPLLQYFRFIYLIPVISILLAASKQKKLIVAGFMIFSLAYLFFPQFHREDWKNLVANLPESKPVYMIVSSSDPVKYYNSNIVVKDLALLPDVEEGQSEIVIIPYTADIHGIDYKTILTGKKYQLIDKKTFRDLEVETWKR